MFLISFLLYLLFLVLFSTFLGLMYFRTPKPRMRPWNLRAMPMSMCDFGARSPRGSNLSDALSSYKNTFNAVRLIETKLEKKRKHNARFFTGCSSKKNFYDPSLCSVEILLVLSLRFIFIFKGRVKKKDRKNGKFHIRS